AASDNDENRPYPPWKNTSGSAVEPTSSSRTLPITMKWSPASCTTSMSQSIQASTPSRTGEPEPAGCHDSSANLSPPLTANVRQTDSWSEPRMLTQKWPESRNFGQLLELLSGMNATSGGSSETELNDP